MGAKIKDNCIVSTCPDCEGALSNFEFQSGSVIRNEIHTYENTRFERILYLLARCGGCGRGGLAVIHDNGMVRNGILAGCGVRRDKPAWSRE